MRIRTIKPEFFLHEELHELEKETGLPVRVAFIGLWCAADREGRFKWEPRKLGVTILPYDDVDFSRVLDALTTRDFVVKYASSAGTFGFIPSFNKHQVINNRERASEYPQPPKIEAIDASSTRQARVDDETPPTKSGREGKGREHVEERVSARASAAEWAEKIRQAYPSQTHQQQARDAVTSSLSKGDAPEVMLQSVRECAAIVRAAEVKAGGPIRWVPSPATFFEAETWREPMRFAETLKPKNGTQAPKIGARPLTPHTGAF